MGSIEAAANTVISEAVVLEIEVEGNKVVGSKTLSLGKRVPTRADQVLLAQQIGERMLEAREMQGYSQIRAGQLFGYSNGSKLAKIEGGRESSQVPAWVLKRAGQVYDVSVDYLLGNTERMEVDEQRSQAARDMIILMRDQWEQQQWRDTLIIRSALDRVTAMEEDIQLLSSQLNEAVMALSRIEKLNPEHWDEIRGGSRLQSVMKRAAATVRATEGKLKRMRQEAKAAAGGVRPELDLVY